MKKEEILCALPTPCCVVDEAALKHNLEILHDVMERAGCDILLAQKAYSCYRTYPLIAQYLSGTTASGLYEARLAHEEMGNRQVHVFSPAYKDNDFDELLKLGFTISAETECKLILLMQTDARTCLLFSAGDVKCGKLVKETAPGYNGRGGGRDDNARAVFSEIRDMKAFARAAAGMIE